ncbi:MAG TPA: YciI family protein [Candidatus Sulfotelmatobacter sp.]|nr:YciI family protein [Candidatus Sulfotelmatobacter sp.]
MKYICLGYIEPGKFEGMTEDERHATFDECFEYNDHLRANGHLVAEVPLQPPETALTLYWKNGKVTTTDGHYAETKEQETFPQRNRESKSVGSGEENCVYDWRVTRNSWTKWEMHVNESEKMLGSVAAQLMNGEEVVVEDQKIKVRRVGSGRLRMVQFRMNGRVIDAIEQNRDKPSRWGKLAREKHQVVQFRDVETNRYLAVSVDGEVREYGK